MRATATNKVSPPERTGFVGFSRFLGQCLEIKAGFTCDKDADWITGVLERRGLTVNYPGRARDWFTWWPTCSCGVSLGKGVVKQGLEAVILSRWSNK